MAVERFVAPQPPGSHPGTSALADSSGLCANMVAALRRVGGGTAGERAQVWGQAVVGNWFGERAVLLCAAACMSFSPSKISVFAAAAPQGSRYHGPPALNPKP